MSVSANKDESESDASKENMAGLSANVIRNGFDAPLVYRLLNVG